MANTEENQGESPIESVKQSLAMRLKNPVLGSFAVAWCITNWKLLAILFVGSGAIEARIKLISEEYISIKPMLCHPATATIIVLILIPIFDVVISWIRVYPTKLIWNAHHNIEKHILDKAEEDSAQKRRIAENIRAAQNSEARILRNEIVSLGRQKAALELEIAKKQKQVSRDSSIFADPSGSRIEDAAADSLKNRSSSEERSDYFLYIGGAADSENYAKRKWPFYKVQNCTSEDAVRICNLINQRLPKDVKSTVKKISEMKSSELVDASMIINDFSVVRGEDRPMRMLMETARELAHDACKTLNV